MKTRLIAILDSGFGGEIIQKKLSGIANTVLYKDTKNFPYGNKTKRELRKIGWKNIRFLLKFKPSVIVIGCNTLTIAGMEYFREKTRVPIIGTVEPTLKAIDKKIKRKNFLVLGTQLTIKSRIYQGKGIMCGKLVSLIENRKFNEAKVYVNKLFSKRRSKYVILGCTHYHTIRNLIKNRFVIDSTNETVKEVRRFLNDRD